MRWHYSRNVLPSGKCVALLGWCFGSNNLFAVNDGLALDNLLTNLEHCLIRVDRERTRHLYILCRHRLGQTLPAGERVALLLGSWLGYDCSAVVYLNRLVFCAVNLVHERVLVHGVRTHNHDVVRWHCRWNVLPSGECVSFLGWCFGSDNLFAVNDSLALDNLLTNLEDSLVRVDRERTRHLYIVSRHRLGQTLPA